MTSSVNGAFDSATITSIDMSKDSIVSACFVVTALALVCLSSNAQAQNFDTNQFTSGVIGLEKEAIRIAQTGDFKGVAALAKAYPAMQAEILETALRAVPSRRSELIALVAKESPDQRLALTIAVGRSTTPALYESEVGGLLGQLSAADMVKASTQIIAKNTTVALQVALALGLKSGIPQAKLASVLAAASPSSAPAVVAGLIMTKSEELSDNEIPVFYATVASAAAAKAPGQAAAIVSDPNVLKITLEAWKQLGAGYFTTSVAATMAASVAKVAPTQAAAIAAAMAKAYPGSWTYSTSAAVQEIVGAIGQAVPAAQSKDIATAAAAAVRSRTDVVWDSRIQVEFEATIQIPNPTIMALVQSAVTAGQSAAAAPLPTTSRPAEVAPNTSTTPSIPIDPSLVVSPSK